MPIAYLTNNLFFARRQVVSFHPQNKFSIDSKLMSNDDRFAMKILPIRCFIDQKVIHFVQDFFDVDAGVEGCMSSTNNDAPGSLLDGRLRTEDDELMAARENEAFFKSANVNKCKMKIDYTPVGVDVDQLQRGKYSELLNMFNLESMQLTFEHLEMKNISGWGGLFSQMCKLWVEHIAATQVHKFIQATPPFNTISTIGSAIGDLVLIPANEYKKTRTKSALGRGFKKGFKQFGKNGEARVQHSRMQYIHIYMYTYIYIYIRVYIHIANNLTPPTTNPIPSHFSFHQTVIFTMKSCR